MELIWSTFWYILHSCHLISSLKAYGTHITLSLHYFASQGKGSHTVPTKDWWWNGCGISIPKRWSMRARTHEIHSKFWVGNDKIWWTDTKCWELQKSTEFYHLHQWNGTFGMNISHHFQEQWWRCGLWMGFGAEDFAWSMTTSSFVKHPLSIFISFISDLWPITHRGIITLIAPPCSFNTYILYNKMLNYM